MKIIFALAGLALAACKSQKPVAPAVESAPAAEQNRVEKYASGLHGAATSAQAAKEKADAANAKFEDAQKQAEGQ